MLTVPREICTFTSEKFVLSRDVKHLSEKSTTCELVRLVNFGVGNTTDVSK